METLAELLSGVTPPDAAAAASAARRWDSIAKPLGGLGEFESMVTEMAALRGSAAVDLRRPVLTVLCADNGVVAEGVSQSGLEVTGYVMSAVARGESTSNLMARAAGCPVLAVDMGVRAPVGAPETADLSAALEGPGLALDRRRMDGTDNLRCGPAMERDTCVSAILAGAALAAELAELGYDCILTGEMGIGNTTTSACVAAALLSRPPEDFVGRGAGLSDAMLSRKRAVVREALDRHRPDPGDVVGVLSQVGGLDLAGLCGVFLGGARRRVPVVIDGFISSVAALCALRLCPNAGKAMFASHCSRESGGGLILDALGKKAVIQAGMHLGEGTGALMLLPMLRCALAVYNSGHGFGALGMEPYKKYQ